MKRFLVALCLLCGCITQSNRIDIIEAKGFTDVYLQDSAIQSCPTEYSCWSFTATIKDTERRVWGVLKCRFLNGCRVKISESEFEQVPE